MSDPGRIILSELVIRAAQRVVVDHVSFTLQAGRTTALVGASGSGKTLTARALLGLVQAQPGVVSGSLRVEHQGRQYEPYASSRHREREAAFTAIRGGLIGYLPQEARASLDPQWTVDRQVREVIALRDPRHPPQTAQVHDCLRAAGFADPARVAPLYPHELSGGMAQRACIALALGRGSHFLVADEPTTGLDPTVQREVLSQIRLLREQGIGVLFITHDLRLVPRVADDLLVMHAGRIVDRLPAAQLQSAQSPHARRLIEATSRISGGTL